MPKEIPDLVKKLLVTATNNQQKQLQQFQPQPFMSYRNLFKRDEEFEENSENLNEETEKLSKRSLPEEENNQELLEDESNLKNTSFDTDDSESLEIDNELDESFKSLQRRQQSDDEDNQDISRTSIVENSDE
jgi:hypothetical protein